MAQEGVQQHWFLGIQGKYVSAAERSEQAGLKMAMERVRGWHGRCRWRQPGWWPGLQDKVRWWLRGQPGFQDQGEGCVSLSSSASSCHAAPLPSSKSWSNVLHFQPGGEDFCTVTSEQSLGWCHQPGAGTCSGAGVVGHTESPGMGAKAGGDEGMLPPGHTHGLGQGQQQLLTWL